MHALSCLKHLNSCLYDCLHAIKCSGSKCPVEWVVDKCMHPYPYKEHWKFSRVSLSINYASLRGDCSSDFYHCSLVLPAALHVNEIIPHVLFCVWLLWCKMLLRFIHPVVYIGSVFLYTAMLCSFVGIYFNLFIHSMVEKHLVCYQVFAILINLL